VCVLLLLFAAQVAAALLDDRLLNDAEAAGTVERHLGVLAGLG
jgi:hypothetical protein